MGLILGIDICDDYSQISAFNRDIMDTEGITLGKSAAPYIIPTIICKKKNEDKWLIGEDAYHVALMGAGTTVDRLVNMIHRRTTATIEETKYNSEFLVTRYIDLLVNLARAKYGEDEVESLVFSVAELDGRLAEILTRAAVSLGMKRSQVRVYSHTECFAYYTISQNPEIWNNQVSLFDLREDGLFYYELRAIRGRKPVVIETTKEKMQEGFSIDILDNKSGKQVGNTILSACASRVLDKKIISSVFLTGRGFIDTKWAPDFLGIICQRRRVYSCEKIFSEGAAFAAYDMTLSQSRYPYLLQCEGRLSGTISLTALYESRREQIVLAEAGTNWLYADSVSTFILDDTGEIELILTPVNSNLTNKMTISLSDFPSRPNKTTRIELGLSFASENKLVVRVRDLGFGDLFPSSEIEIKEECDLL